MESKQEMVFKEEGGFEPMSPAGQYFCSSALSLSILAILELDIPLDVSLSMSLLDNVFLAINPRFSSIVVPDAHGIKQWKRVNVKLEDHFKVPIFPVGLLAEAYDKHFQEYLTELAMEQLPQSQPLWEVHLIKYPTTKAVETIVFKLHHALGDGFSLMGALFSCLQRADDPSLPLTIPSLRLETKSSHTERNIFKSVPRFLSMFLNTTTDFFSSLLKSTVLVDDRTPIRSATEGVEFLPSMISTVTFSLDHIKQIKAKINGGTVNDIMISTIFYGSRLYMETESKGSSNACSTALVLFNTRQLNRYLTIREMAKKDVKSLWGNQFTFLHVPIPKFVDPETIDPLKFVSKVKETIERKKNSLGVYLNGILLEMIRKFRGHEATSRTIHSTLKNTSMGITSLIGPIEQVALARHPCKGIYFVVANSPHSLSLSMVSYMGKLRLTVGSEKGFIDHQLFTSCLERAFDRIFKAAVN